ncbi:neutral cholesterol ester hydrolase 1-like isoform X2 [Acanthaster planci]|nr:neutral cholesterol ester hydrolase 1-like isoform X2 [Acanthaster planci]XP_022102066.1 neutral cholesterol ester hydrolase 1-like isoform X2 [Acanthaster planci]XP_022102067.1 neutral cholesterol ester hydrolase 1-like isoform X2 [Acanthaster planci]XP_022102068.1 neutral cholesterol ester hydrolase 1-like isoform X2 [Acanthaster planci]
MCSILAIIRSLLIAALQPVPAGIESPWRLKLFTMLIMVGVALEPYTPKILKKIFDKGSRESMRAAGPNVPYADTTFDGVPVRVYSDEQMGKNACKRPGIVYFHGGGWRYGHVDMAHSVTAEMARTLDAVVVSVEYRLTPKYLFPSSIDDCTKATVSFLQCLQEFNVDPARVAVMGESAGGNLAAAVSQRLAFDPKYKELPKLKMQILLYPCLQAFDFQTPSYQQNRNLLTVVIDINIMAECWAVYLNNRPSLKHQMTSNKHTSVKAKGSPLVKKCLSHDLIPDEFKKRGYFAPSTDFGDEGIYNDIKGVLLDPDYAPLMREDLRGLPEAYILTAEYDVLRDDGIMYAKRLEKAGVPVTWKHYEKGFHAMFSTKNGPLTSPSGDVAVADFFEFAGRSL